MRKWMVIVCLLFAVGLLSFTNKSTALFSIPQGWPAPVYDFKNNQLTEDKIALGRMLFYDPLLSADSTISCASCHSPYNAFTHVDHDLSHGIAGKIGTRNSPALMNLAWGNVFMWDGAVNHLDVQALAPITNALEMGSDIKYVVTKLKTTRNYPALFYKAWGDSAVTGEYVLKSLSQFMLTLVSSNAKYDSVMRGETAFTAQEANGYKVFQQHCASCHKEPLFTNGAFENNGLPVDTSLNDYGRIKVTRNGGDYMKFKVPTLRNIDFSYPYMHDGRFKRLSEVIKHYTSGIVYSPSLAAQLRSPIVLSSNEKVDLVAFLLTLSDKAFIFNAQYAYPKDAFFEAAKD